LRLVLVVIVDSTGLKIYGAGEWNENKHGLSKRRKWRKLHLTINESTLEIIASSLTDNRVGDPNEVPNLLDQVKNPIDELIGDGAYDTKKVYNTVESRAEEGSHNVTVPPQKNAVLSHESKSNPTQRDEHVNFINSHDRSSWESKFRYYRRLLVENTIGRYKGIMAIIAHRAKNVKLAYAFVPLTFKPYNLDDVSYFYFEFLASISMRPNFA